MSNGSLDTAIIVFGVVSLVRDELMGRVIGIDLGTTNSCVAYLSDSEPVVISNSEGMRTTPSIVAFPDGGGVLVGRDAKRWSVSNPSEVCFSIKREMGSKYRFKVRHDSYTPEEISAFIIKKLKRDAEKYIGEEVTDAVITVPAYFSDAQRQATKNAGRIAGLNVLRIINEPTAAALAYGLDNGAGKKIAVLDLGGGTFDVSVIEIADGIIDVLATSGDNMLGGNDFDEVIVEYICKSLKKRLGVNAYKNKLLMRRVIDEAEQVKKELSTAYTAAINIPYIEKNGEMVNFSDEFTRDEFERLTKELADRLMIPFENAIHDAGLKKEEISKVLLIGGATRMPLVQDRVREFLHIDPSRSINPDECVAMGAAIQAGKLSGQVACGSRADTILLMDVTPLSLSVETVGGISNVLIKRNTTIPTRHSQIFTTAANFQTAVDVKVFQGERRFTKDNKLIGNFRLDGIKRKLAGIPQIEVVFDIDANGIVSVSAKDLGTGREQSITISASNNLSEQEIQNAILKAETNEKGDREKEDLFKEKKRAAVLIKKAKEFAASEGGLSKEEAVKIKNEIKKISSYIRKNRFIKHIEISSDRLKRENDSLESLIKR